MKKTLLIVLTLILLGSAGIGGFYLLNRETEKPQDNGDTNQNNNQETDYTIEDLENGLKKYTNHIYDYTFEYPSGWEVRTVTKSPDNTNLISSNQTIVLTLPTKEEIRILIWNNTEDLSLMEWYEQKETSHISLGEDAPDTPNAIVAGENSIVVVRPMKVGVPGEITTLFLKDNNTLQLRFSASESDTDPDPYLHLLRTFEFDGQTTEDELPKITAEDLKEQ